MSGGAHEECLVECSVEHKHPLCDRRRSKKSKNMIFSANFSETEVSIQHVGATENSSRLLGCFVAPETPLRTPFKSSSTGTPSLSAIASRVPNFNRPPFSAARTELAEQSERFASALADRPTPLENNDRADPLTGTEPRSQRPRRSGLPSNFASPGSIRRR